MICQVVEQTAQDRTTKLPGGAEGLYGVFIELILDMQAVEGLEGQRICSFPCLRNRGYMWFHMSRMGME